MPAGLRVLCSSVFTCLAHRPCWRPAAHSLLGSRVAKMSEPKPSGKQASIASFFGGGGQPKRTATSAALSGEAGGAKRSADDEGAPTGAHALTLVARARLWPDAPRLA